MGKMEIRTVEYLENEKGLWSNGLVVQALGGSKALRSKPDLVFHPSEVDKVSTRNF